MKIKIGITIILFVCVSFSSLLAKDKANIIVAQDGSGQFTKIQDAIDSVPEHNQRNVIILIRNGVYHEKLFITKSFISLVGEDRDSTRIIYAQLRRDINKTPLDMTKLALPSHRRRICPIIIIDTSVASLGRTSTFC